MRAYPSTCSTPQEVFAHFLRKGRQAPPPATDHRSAFQRLRDPDAWHTREWIDRGCVVYPIGCDENVRLLVRVATRLARSYQVPLIADAVGIQQVGFAHLLRSDLDARELAVLAQITLEAARSASLEIELLSLPETDQVQLWRVGRG